MYVCSETCLSPHPQEQSHTVCCAVSPSPVLARGHSEVQFFKVEISEVKSVKNSGFPPMALVGEGFG